MKGVPEPQDPLPCPHTLIPTLRAFSEFRTAFPALSHAPATASPPGHLQGLSPFIPSLQFLELSALVYKPCNYIQINLSKSRSSSVGPVWPRLRSSEVHESVRDRPCSTSLPEQCHHSRNRHTRTRT